MTLACPWAALKDLKGCSRRAQAVLSMRFRPKKNGTNRPTPSQNQYESPVQLFVIAYVMLFFSTFDFKSVTHLRSIGWTRLVFSGRNATFVAQEQVKKINGPPVKQWCLRVRTQVVKRFKQNVSLFNEKILQDGRIKACRHLHVVGNCNFCLATKIYLNVYNPLKKIACSWIHHSLRVVGLPFISVCPWLSHFSVLRFQYKSVASNVSKSLAGDMDPSAGSRQHLLLRLRCGTLVEHTGPQGN